MLKNVKSAFEYHISLYSGVELCTSIVNRANRVKRVYYIMLTLFINTLNTPHETTQAIKEND